MEDYNSFGAHAALKARRVVERVSEVVAIELLCAAEALEYQRPLRSGAGIEARVRGRARGRAPSARAIGHPAPDIQRHHRIDRRGPLLGLAS